MKGRGRGRVSENSFARHHVLLFSDNVVNVSFLSGIFAEKASKETQEEKVPLVLLFDI